MTTTAPDFGRDLSCVEDFNPRGTEVTGIESLRQWGLRVLDTPTGSLIDDEDGEHGFDLVGRLSRGITRDEIDALPGQIAAAYENDERFLPGSVKALVRFTGETLRVSIKASSTSGPFSLVVDASAAGIAFAEGDDVE
jgi:hypothetical protein